MNIVRLLGIGAKKILDAGCSVSGTVTKVSRCWWFSVKIKPARLYANRENTLNPHVITFTYTVEGIVYTGHMWVGVRYRVPNKGEVITVFYNPDKPQHYACYALGPGPWQGPYY